MKKLFLIILTVSLAACGSSGTDQTRQIDPAEISQIPVNYAWSGHYDIESAAGFRISTDQNPVITAELVDKNWRLVQACTSIFIDSDRPVVLEYSDDLPDSVSGFHFIETNYVHIRVYKNDLTRRDALFMQVTRHEMIHELLRLNNIPDFDHQSGLFKCEAI